MCSGSPSEDSTKETRSLWLWVPASMYRGASALRQDTKRGMTMYRTQVEVGSTGMVVYHGRSLHGALRALAESDWADNRWTERTHPLGGWDTITGVWTVHQKGGDTQ